MPSRKRQSLPLTRVFSDYVKLLPLITFFQTRESHYYWHLSFRHYQVPAINKRLSDTQVAVTNTSVSDIVKSFRFKSLSDTIKSMPTSICFQTSLQLQVFFGHFVPVHKLNLFLIQLVSVVLQDWYQFSIFRKVFYSSYVPSSEMNNAVLRIKLSTSCLEEVRFDSHPGSLYMIKVIHEFR